MHHKTEELESLLGAQPVVPVLILDDAEVAVPLARALHAGGISTIEITLRTEAAFEAVRRIVEEVEEVAVGVGTVLAPDHLKRAERSGARFWVSPGMSPQLLEAARHCVLPGLPGSATPSEAMALVEAGYHHQKFFPAEAAGGAAYLKSLVSPLGEIRFCPTGGINPGNAGDYLALPNVACVGGSWLAPKEAIAAGDWAKIESLAREAVNLRKP
ncbi:bifunctional 4-hydroxy-2-oxoglutarate aldolase/2-dehydro-3-deoxy-phosphogluconate aldolase [Afifella sp. H1R]|uniref:bifunctional 4-hydroxy-2-oxoglutarate aldolase/2-dehydro-3-deoxy-phosphogluconate aldolase n=1 Tax=Afifella sp. H1R TaxID=2908841 RepID=UPI001F1BEA0E|nr:bifunctional 4-hydroxy-2-oxoglutarate aldolase/2-dehydro-3-deoxy-phosphogluconate aldolase [Afifella sp. H1R]MCF1505220.1 bifunctional 4-hydroxy-2-oxoglutarate aldolase/2-dehydro-3-deoxy-phosphogluconate aldolase [Afifella sp. H1R]